MGGSSTSRVVSAPGKVLIAGGYLILDPDQIGLVFALSARVYVRITQEDGGDGIFTVTSPQFLNATWKYKCYNRDKDLHIEDLTPESSNNYVRLTIAYVLACLPDECSFPNFSIEILADNDYYSQPSCSTYDDLVQLPQFNELNKPISEVNKTGLGSSAALITALTGALVSMLWVVDQKLSTPYAHKVVHNLAQAAHCAAQGKIGSGFDIAAAVYGSCIYRRFNPTTLETFLIDADVYTSQFRKRLASLVETKWAMEITPFTLPSGLRVVMGDVTGGSETPSMVRSVLKWKHKNAETSKIWNSLGVANRNLIDRFADIPVANKRDVVDGVLTRHHQDNLSSKSSLIKTLNDVAECFEEIRGLLRLMGQQASVPIEPPTQTALLDDSLKVDGVLLAGVPGAGGYDAIFCLIADDDDHGVYSQLQSVWKKREVRVCPLLAQHDSEGLRVKFGDSK